MTVEKSFLIYFRLQYKIKCIDICLFYSLVAQAKCSTIYSHTDLLILIKNILTTVIF